MTCCGEQFSGSHRFAQSEAAPTAPVIRGPYRVVAGDVSAACPEHVEALNGSAEPLIGAGIPRATPLLGMRRPPFGHRDELTS